VSKEKDPDCLVFREETTSELDAPTLDGGKVVGVLSMESTDPEGSTLPYPALDGDMILAAQAHDVASTREQAVILTTSVRHLEFLSDARL